MAYAQLARHLRFETSSSRSTALQHSSYVALQGLALQQAAGMNPRQVAMVLTSLAWMQCPATEEAGPPAQLDTAQPANADTAQPTRGAAAAAKKPVHVDSPAAQLEAEGAAAGAGPSSGDGADRAYSASQQQQGQKALLQLLSQRLQSLLDSFEPEDTCHCLWALSKLDALQPQLLAAATAHGLKTGWLHMLTAKPLSSLLWVHAQAHLKQQQQQSLTVQEPQLDASAAVAAAAGGVQQGLVSQLVSTVIQEVSQPGFLATWTPQEVSMLLWSCAVLGVPLEQPTTPQQQQQLLYEQHKEHGCPQPQHAAAIRAQLPLSVLQEVCQLARQHVVQFTPQGVAMVCWSLAELLTAAAAGAAGTDVGLAPLQLQQQRTVQSFAAALPLQLQQAVLGLFEAFTAAAAARLHYYKPQEVSNIFTACSRLQLLPGALKQSVEGYISSHTHLLGCRDVTDFLLAAAQLQKQRPAQQQFLQARWGHLQAGQQQQRVQRGIPGLGPVAVRALLHRAGQLNPDMTTFQHAATAWACVRLAQLQAVASISSSGDAGSTLADECLAVASSLLQALDGQVEAAAAADGAYAAASGLDGMGSGDAKQAVALAWAIAAIASSYNSSDGDSAYVQQLQQPALLTAVLQQLQQQIGACDGLGLVQVLCVLACLQPAMRSHASRADSHQQPQQALLQELQMTAVARLLPLLRQLPAAEAAAAACAAVKLQVHSQHTRGNSQGHAQLQAGAQRPDATSGLSAVLEQLWRRQQLSSLSDDSVISLLWSCKLTGWVPPAAVYCDLLAAADARLLQLSAHQQVLLLQAVAGAAGGMLEGQAGERAQYLQQMQGRQQHLMQGVVEQLQMQLHQQASQLEFELRHPVPANSGSRGAALAAPAYSTQQAGLSSHDLIAVIEACKSLQLPQGSQLLQQVLDVWQLLQQQKRAVSTRHALLMVYHLADVLPDSPAKPWHVEVLQYKPQQYQHNPQHFPEQPKLMPQLLQQAVTALAAELSAHGTQPPQQPRAKTLVLALRVCAKLRYQLPAQVLTPLLQQLQAAVPVLAEPDIIAALVALAQAAMPAPALASAALAELSARQSVQPGTSARMQPAMQADGQDGQGQLQQSGSQWRSRPPAESLALLWAVLCSAAHAQDSAAAAVPYSTMRFLQKLAHDASDVSAQKLLQDPQLLLTFQQTWHTLHGLPQFKWVRRSLYICGMRTPQAMLLQQLKYLSQLMLPSSISGRAHKHALLQLLYASPQQRRVWLQQRMHAVQQAHATAVSPAHQQQQTGQHVQGDAPVLSGLLPLWLQHQLQKQCQRRLATELVSAQRAAGQVPCDMRLRVLSSGEVVLLLQRPKHQQRGASKGQPSAAAGLPGGAAGSQHSNSSRGSSSDRHKGVAVVLEAPADRAVNTTRQLGVAAARDALLRAKGYHVLALPLQLWLPDFVLQHQQGLQLQQYEQLPGKYQHVQKLVWKRGRRDRTARREHLQQVLQALQQLE